jgi:hypothetical protein
MGYLLAVWMSTPDDRALAYPTTGTQSVEMPIANRVDSRGV